MVTPELISQAKARDEGAFERLLRQCLPRLRPHIRNFAGQSLGPDFSMDDVTQQVAATLWDALPDLHFEEAKPLHDWLRKVARNIIRNRIHYVQGKGRSLASPPRTRREESAVRAGPPMPGPSDTSRVRRDDERAKVASLIPELPSRLREVAKSRFLDGLSFAEIAREHDVSKATVHRLVEQAAQRIAPRLDPR